MVDVLFAATDKVLDGVKQKERILVVDDEKDIVTLVGYHLGNSGLEITPAYNGVEALEKVREVRPDLIILDIMMPELDGIEVCRILRDGGDATTRDIPVVMLTARTDVEDKVKVLSIGADDYVTKPFDLKELGIRVENLLSKRRAKKEVEDRIRALQEKFYKPVDLKSLDTYTHCLDGRLRIRVPAIKGRPERGAAIKRQLASVEGLVKTDISHLTGSILIHFDPSKANVDSIVRYLSSMEAFHGTLLHTIPGKDKEHSVGSAVGKTVIQSVIESLILAAI